VWSIPALFHCHGTPPSKRKETHSRHPLIEESSIIERAEQCTSFLKVYGVRITIEGTDWKSSAIGENGVDKREVTDEEVGKS
jgi:hypothetical protein